MQTGFGFEETECARVWRLDSTKGAENCWAFGVAVTTGQRGLLGALGDGSETRPGGGLCSHLSLSEVRAMEGGRGRKDWIGLRCN